MSTTALEIPVAPSYLAALIAANPALAAINAEALSGSAKPMPPSIVANKGKFTKKVDGVEETITFPNIPANVAAGIVGMPVPQLQAIMLKAKAGKEKAWYATKYTPGQETQSPDCSSDDGIKPLADSRLKQCDNCASCPQNVFGSGTDASGNPTGGKACADRKVVAMYAAGSAFRFVIPPASLKTWDTYCNQLSTKGLPLPAVITVIGFEQGDTDYKLTFTFGGMLAEEQLGKVVQMLETPEVKEITSPRNAPAQIAAPQENKQLENNVVDMAAEKAKKDTEAAEKKKAEAAEKKRLAEEKKKAEAAAAAAGAQAGGGLGIDLSGGAVTAAVQETAKPADVAAEDAELIASLGL